MATRNGAAYVAQQIDSILPQMSDRDELVISDDCSSDATVDIIKQYRDPRIRLFQNEQPRGIIKNFEFCLRQSRGEIIFLADQDDIWLHRKLEVMSLHLQFHDLVVCDCMLVDDMMKPVGVTFFQKNGSGKGFVKNIFRNSYMGCCIAFRRRLLERALPFPEDIPIHDFWIGLVAELYYDVHFINEVLVYHRKHTSNASTTGYKSRWSLQQKLTHRLRIIKNLFLNNRYAG